MKLMILALLTLMPAMGFEWQSVNYQEVKYLPLEQVAEFYGMDDDGEGSLSSATLKLKFKSGESQAILSGVPCNLIHPIALIDQKRYLAEVDLTHLLDPILRPAKIKLPGPITTIVLDPAFSGEGGDIKIDDQEKTDPLLDLALKIRETLEQSGLQLVMTREEQRALPIADSIKIANGVENVLFMRLQLLEPATKGGYQVLSLHGPDSNANPELKKASMSVACAAHWRYLARRTQSRLKELPDLGFGFASGTDYHALTCPAIEVRVSQFTLSEDGELLAKALKESVIMAIKAMTGKSGQ